MYTPIHLIQGIRYFTSSIGQKLHGPRKYKGDAKDICKAIVKNCWNGRYFQASTHHYREFWARDIGYCAESLIKLGHRDKVRKSLRYALEKYKKTGIKTTISKHGTPFSFPNVYSPDSVALIMHALRVSKDNKLISEYKSFLQKEADKFAKVVLKNGRVKRNTHFSSMRDYAVNDSSCYNHCMAILMARETKKLGLKFAYTERELVKILNEYWVGTHYRDDRRNLDISGDSNTFPYWLGVGKHFSKATKTLHANRLDTPLPLKYSNHSKGMIKAEVFVKDWETNSSWPFMGLLFVHAVKKHDKKLAKRYRQGYTTIIENYGTLYEVYQGTKPYRSLFYHADEGMLWASIYLTL